MSLAYGMALFSLIVTDSELGNTLLVAKRPRKPNLYWACYLRVIRAENGALSIFFHSDRRCAASGEELNSFSARSRLSSIRASCIGLKKIGQVSFAAPLGDTESSCRSSVELSVRLVAVKPWCPLKPDGPVN